MLQEEERFGIKNLKLIKDLVKEYKIRENVLSNIKKLKSQNKKIVVFGAPVKQRLLLIF